MPKTIGTPFYWDTLKKLAFIKSNKYQFFGRKRPQIFQALAFALTLMSAQNNNGFQILCAPNFIFVDKTLIDASNI